MLLLSRAGRSPTSPLTSPGSTSGPAPSLAAGDGQPPGPADPEPPAGLTPAQRYGQEYDQLITLFEALDPEAPGLELRPAAEEGGLLAAPDGARDRGAPLGRPARHRRG